jgi:hypothetical protein
MSSSVVPVGSLTLGQQKKRPVQLYECAVCGKNIADEAVPVAIRVAVFVVPQAARDRRLDQRPFDITDVGLPPLVRELVDQDKHPDGHVYLGLGCFMQLMGPEFHPVNAAGDVVPLVPRAALDALGVANTEFTGREHRPPSMPEAVGGAHPFPVTGPATATQLLAAAAALAAREGTTLAALMLAP